VDVCIDTLTNGRVTEPKSAGHGDADVGDDLGLEQGFDGVGLGEQSVIMMTCHNPSSLIGAFG
jgi:hypothetical protein